METTVRSPRRARTEGIASTGDADPAGWDARRGHASRPARRPDGVRRNAGGIRDGLFRKHRLAVTGVGG